METEIQQDQEQIQEQQPESLEELAQEGLSKLSQESDAPTGEEVQATPEESSVVGEQAKDEGQPAPEVFQPNLEFEVMGEKKAFDDRFKDFIKSKEDEDLVRDLYERADGIEKVKEGRDYYRSQFKDQNTEVQAVLQAAQLGDLKTVYESVGIDTSNPTKLLENIQQSFGLSKRAFAEFAVQQLNLTSEQEQLQTQLRDAEMQNQRLQQQQQQSQAQHEQFLAQQRHNELNQVLSMPEFAPIIEKINATRGNSNSFFEECWNRGVAHVQTTGEDIAPLQVVQQIIEQYKPFLQFSQPQETVQAPVQQQGQAQPSPTTPPEPKPTMPNLSSGGSQVPAKRAIKTMEDLKREANDRLMELNN